MKSVMISIDPKQCKLIASGEKTIEVQKTKPRLETPFKCYIYCTGFKYFYSFGGQRVIGEFVCDTFITDKTYGHDTLFNSAACINEYEAIEYSSGKILYGWHISDLKLYDKPKELSEFFDKKIERIKRPFQSWGYVYDWSAELS